MVGGREMEEDIWVEYLALRRGGWSEVRWRELLRVAQEQRRQQQRWWDLVELWATERWGGIVGGETIAADLVWQATGDRTGGGNQAVELECQYAASGLGHGGSGVGQEVVEEVV